MIRGLRILPATTTTSRQAFDRSKLPFSPTTRSRPKPSFQGSERAGWVSVPVQATPVAAEAAAKSAEAAATFAKNAAKVVRNPRRNYGRGYDSRGTARVSLMGFNPIPALPGDCRRVSPVEHCREDEVASRYCRRVSRRESERWIGCSFP